VSAAISRAGAASVGSASKRRGLDGNRGVDTPRLSFEWLAGARAWLQEDGALPAVFETVVGRTATRALRDGNATDGAGEPLPTVGPMPISMGGAFAVAAVS